MAVSVRIFGGALGTYSAVARAADEAGFHGIWVPDHVVAMTEVATAYPYSQTGRPRFEGETPFGDPVVMLSHLAAVTTHIRLGVGVYVLPLRHPLHAARQLMTLQVLSGGRLRLGVGVGWKAEEFEALGADFRGRGARAEEAVEVMRLAWTGRPVSFNGDHHRFPELQMSPSVPQPIPVFWGGAGEASVRRAVRMADGLYAPPGDLDATVGLLRRMDDKLGRAGRDRATFRFVARCPEGDEPDLIDALRAEGADEVVVNVPRDLLGADEQVGWLRDMASVLRRRGILMPRIDDRPENPSGSGRGREDHA